MEATVFFREGPLKRLGNDLSIGDQKYGTLLEAGQSPPEFSFVSNQPDLDKVVNLPGLVKKACLKVRQFGIDFSPQYWQFEEFSLSGVVSYSKLGALRRFSFTDDDWIFYSFTAISGGKEHEVLGQGVAVPRWVGEEDIAVLDHLWTTSGDLEDKAAMLWSIEQDILKEGHKAIRLCRGFYRTQDSEFFRRQGYQTVALFDYHGNKSMIKLFNQTNPHLPQSE